MAMERVSNYVKLCEEWAEKVLAMDEDDLLRRVPELHRTDKYLEITHFGIHYGISRKDGRIVILKDVGCTDDQERTDICGKKNSETNICLRQKKAKMNSIVENQEEDRCLESNRKPNVTAMLNIYTLLGYAKEGAFLMNKWVPFAELRGARPFGPAYKIGVTDVFAATFSGHLKELHAACKRLGGTPLPQGDAGYQIDAFACEPMQFYFWDCDDEFAAQANILFDYSATDFNHVESAVSTAEEGVRRLAEEAGVPVRGRHFQMR